MKAQAKPKAPYFETTVSVDTDVEIDPSDLHDAGWHHETECAGTEVAVPLTAGRITYREAIASLHRQAHPGQLADPLACPEEPCRELSFAQLHMPMGRGP